MRHKIRLLIVLVVFAALDSVFFTNCSNIGFGGSDTQPSKGTEVVNPLTSAAQLVAALCHTIESGHAGLQDATCVKGVEAENISSNFGVANNAMNPIGVLVSIDAVTSIGGDASAFNQCLSDISALSPQSVQSAYVTSQADPFSGVAAIVPKSSCSQVYASPTIPANAGLFLGLSFQNLSLNDNQRLYSIGTSILQSGWCDINGTDSIYGLGNPRYPASPWGGTASAIDSMQLIQDTRTDNVRNIVTDNSVPPGVSNQVLQMSMNAPYDATVGGVSGGIGQTAFNVQVDTSQAQGMVYFSKWMWLQVDMPSRGPFQWYSVAGFSTNITERFGLNISEASYSPYGSSTPAFVISHDGYPGGAYQVYADYFLSPSASAGAMVNGQTYYAPVPLGRWFRVEYAFNRKLGGTGWVWIALTVPSSADPNLQKGVEVYAASGPLNFNYNGSDPETIGWNAYNSNPINKLNPFSSTSDMTRSAASPYVSKTTNVEVWTRWPSNATAHPGAFN